MTLTTRAASLGLALAFLLPTAATATTTPDPTDPLDQVVSDAESIEKEQVVVDRGHLDVGPRIIDGEWQNLIRDDSVSPAVWRQPEDVVVHIDSDSTLVMPEDEEFSFINAEPGDELYVIPQTQLTKVAWLGWNTQDPNVVEQIVGGATLRFHGYEGPGEFTLFLQNGNFEPPTLLWDGANPEPQDVWAIANTHVHANWVFTEPGIYHVDVEITADLKDGSTVSDRDYFTIAVGDDIDPASGFASLAALEEEDGNSQAGGADSDNDDEMASETESGSDTHAGDASSEASEVAGSEPSDSGGAEATGNNDVDDGRVSSGLLISAIVGVVILLLGGIGIMRSRKARQTAMSERRAHGGGREKSEEGR